MNKRLSNRWSMQAGGSHTWAHDFPDTYPNNPNGTFDEDTSRWDFKVSGTYEAPWGIRLSPLVRHQAGVELRATDLGWHRRRPRRRARSSAARSTPSRSTRAGTTTSPCSICGRACVHPRRHDLRVRGLFDLFNITNSNAAETRTITTGTIVPATDGDSGAADGEARRQAAVVGGRSQGSGISNAFCCLVPGA